MQNEKKEKKKKPDYIRDDAWKMYQTYNHTHLDPYISEEQKAQEIEKARIFFDKTFFSQEAKDLWKKFPKDKDAGEFVRVMYISCINSSGERDAKLRSAELKKEIPKDIRKLKNDLKNTGYISELHNFIHDNGTLKIVDSNGDLKSTDIIKILDSLEKFVENAKIGIKGSALTSRANAIQFRERNDDVDFVRCLYNEMITTLNFKQGKDTNNLILNTLYCVFPDDIYDGKFSTKFVRDTIKKVKLSR